MSHRSEKEIKALLIEARSYLVTGNKFFHYKNPEREYLVIDVVLLEVTQEPAVVYFSMDNEDVKWIRKATEFFGFINHEGEEFIRRFRPVE